MKIFKHLLILTGFLFISLSGLSQNWLSEMDNGNVYTAKSYFDQHWEGRTPGKGQGYKQFNRWYHRWESRTFPTGEMSSVKYAEGLRQHRDNITSQGQNRSSTSQWTTYGPFNPAFNGSNGIGRVNVVEIHPTLPNTVFIGTPGGGLWKSTDDGTSWTPLTDDLTNLGISDIAIDPSNPNIMYVATGDRDARDTYSFGLLKSTDGGINWNATGLTFTVQSQNTTNRVLIDPSNSNNIIVATGNGIYRSTNAGSTFTQTFTGKHMMSMEFHPTNSNIMYAGEYDPSSTTAGLYKSINNGVSWTQITSGLPSTGSLRLAIAVTPANANYVYVLIADDNYGLKGVYRSINSGTSFSTMMTSPNILDWDDGSASDGQGWYDLALAASTTNANEIYVGGINIWKSTNGGTSFNRLTNWYNNGVHETVHADQHWFRTSGSNLYVGNDGGLFKSSNGGASFSELCNDIAISQIYKFSNDQITNDKIIIGLQDNGTRIKNGANYDFVIGGDGMDCIIDHTDNNIVFGSLYYGDIRRSSNGGASFSQVGPNTGNGAWVTPYVMDPNNHDIMYLGDNDIYKSTNNGVTWSVAASGVSTELMRSMTVSKANSNVVYAASYSDLYKSTNGGTSWTNITGTLPTGSASISSICADPTDENTLWVTFSGYSSNNKVYKSTNQGGSWFNNSGSLPNLPVNDIIYQEGSSGILYIGNDVGVYYLDPAIGNWQVYGTDLPNVIVTDLEIQYNQAKLRVSTYGRGVWEIGSQPTAAPTAGLLASAANVCVGGTINYTNTSVGGDTYSWNFEGGTPSTSTDENPVITYNTPGTYYINMTATNSNGSDYIEYLGAITVENQQISFTPLGNASNVYTNLSNNTQPVVVNNDLNTVAFIHRQNINEFSGTSGSFRYDYSTDNGQTWTNNSNILNSSAIAGTNDGRYPQIGIYNPTSNTTPANASIIYQGATIGGSWNGYVTGSGNIGGTTYSENYNQATGTNTLIPGSMSKGGNDTYWSVDVINNGTSSTGLRVLKGTWSGTELVWTQNNLLTPSFNTAFNGNPVINDYQIAFDETGQNGWIVMLSHLTTGNATYQLSPILFQTTNGGSTWSAPISIDLTSFTSITNNTTLNPTTGFQIELSVDNNGNPHCLFLVGEGDGTNYSIQTGNWMGACHLHYNGAIWEADILDQIESFRNTFPNGAVHDNTPQISRSDNGNFIVMAWTDSDAAVTAGANSIPSMKIGTYNVATDVHSVIETVDECVLDPGKMILLKIADNLLERADGYHVAGVVSQLNGATEEDETGHNFFTYPIPNTCTATADISTSTSSCVNQSVTITNNSTNTAGYTLTWDVDNNGSTDYTTSGNVNHTYTTGGPKTISLTLNDGAGCITNTTTSININELPNLSVTNPSAVCGLNDIEYTNNSTVVEPANYEWNFDGNGSIDATTNTDQIFTPTGYGALNGLLTVTDFNGCVSTLPLSVNVNENPSASFSVPSFGCQNESITFTDASSNTTSYEWDIDNNGSVDYTTNGSISHTYTTGGIKTIKLTVLNGDCQDGQLAQINITELPTASFTTTHLGGTTFLFENTSSNGTSYAWDFGDGNTSNSNGDVTHTFDGSQAYTVSLTATNNCGDNTDINLTSATVGIEDNDKNQIVISPNPANNKVNITLFEGESTIKIYNNVGQIVYNEQTANDQLTIDTDKFADGNYFVQIINNNQRVIEKLIIKH